MGKQARKPRKQKGPNRSGRTKEQGVPLALAAVRHRTFLQNLPKCRYCGQVAMRGLMVCRSHGGAAIAARRGEYVRANVKSLPALGPMPPAPDALRKHPAWPAIAALPDAKIRRAIEAFNNRRAAPELWNVWAETYG